jgi:hypothetical protein
MITPVDLLESGVWRPLATASRDPKILHVLGLCRIRRIGPEDLDDIG